MAERAAGPSGGFDDPLPADTSRRRLVAALRQRGAVFVRGGEAELLARRVPSEARLVDVPEGSLLAREILGWVLAEIGEAVAGPPEARLREVLPGLSRPLCVLVRQAGALPPTEWSRLEALAAGSDGRLMVLAHDPEPAEEPRQTDLGQPLGDLGEIEAAPAPLEPGVFEPEPPAEVDPDAAEPALEALDDLEALEPEAPHAAGGASPLSGPAAEAEPWLPAECLRALGRLLGALRGGTPAVALSGPPGAGKTVALRALARRLPPAFDPVFVPFMALERAEFLRWMLHCRGAASSPSDPEAAWEAELAQASRRGTPVVVLLDDAGSLPRELADFLVEWASRSKGHLRLVMSVCEGAGQLPTVRNLERVRLEGTLESHEPERMLARSQPEADPAASVPAPEGAARLPGDVFRDAEADPARHASPPPPRAQASPPVAPPPAQPPPPAADAPAPRSPAAPAAEARPRRWPVALAGLLLGVGLVLVLARMASPPAPGPSPAAPEAMAVRIDAAPGARILVDGEEVGVAPLEPVMLPRGTHRIRAELPDGRVIEREVVVEEAPPDLQVTP